ncbi:S-crystallin [Trema orientale]|uniref:S-crystallin n=1 Tax=Trema orientale TaxID=63057 RepID=A0A2P5EC17_TREOI|nr:S-crystallin [Trema orientale]
MAGALNLAPPPIFAPFSRRTVRPKTLFSIRASSSSGSSENPSSLSPSSSSSWTFAPPPNFKAPEPKRFGVRPDKAWDIFGASLALFFRFGTGVFGSGYSVSLVPKDEFPPGQYALDFNDYKVKETSKLGPRPEKPIEIYEFESCPFCRKVREIIAVLDIDVLFYPCPRNGPNFRPKVAQIGGKQQFPYMVDPNTGVSMYESDDIIKYLVGKYGDGNVPIMLSLGLLTTITAGLALSGRAGKGSTYSPAKLPPKPLEIWAYEGSPFCKYVREVLVELELPHLQRSCSRGSPKRQILYEKVGHFQVPYLQDPNTGVEMFESAEIVEYIRATYAIQ